MDLRHLFSSPSAPYEETIPEGGRPPVLGKIWSKIIAAFSAPHMQPEILSGAAPFAEPAQAVERSAEASNVTWIIESLSGVDPQIMGEIREECRSGESEGSIYDRYLYDGPSC